jgi:hypothetical protein
MAMIDWRISAYDLTTCNCAWGCPCQFNALPTSGSCMAGVAFHVVDGHFGNTPIDGLTFGGLFRWPGPIHLGGGEALPLIDERASDAQRHALLQIMSGAETDPGATIFNVFAATYAKVHEPRFVPIAFEFDLDAATGRFRVPSIVDARVAPIRSPVTGAVGRARVVLKDSFEFAEAEFASSTIETGDSPFALDWVDRHAHLSLIEMTGRGLVRH